MELYIIKSGLAISFLFVFYWLFLRNETYYKWNRIYLLVSLLVSIFLPFWNINIFADHGSYVADIMEPIVINAFIRPSLAINTKNSLSILSIIYISGVVFFFLRFLLSIVKLHYLYFRFSKVKYNGFKAVILDTDQSPFSFFNILFISGNDYMNGKIDEIIVHEKAHRDEHHSFDIILLEVMSILQWFNPFIWLFRQAIKSEHEFFADNKVLQEGFEKLKYQKLLFAKSLGITSFHLSNSFNYSLLKKRIKMMTNKKSSSLVKIKYLLSVPFILFTMLLISINYNSYAQDDKVYEEVDVMATYKGGSISGVREFIAQNITYPESARENKTSAKIYVQFVVDENGEVDDVHITRTDILDNVEKEVVVVGYASDKNPEINSKSVADLEAEAIRVIKLLDGFTAAQTDGKNVKTQFTFPIEFALK